MYMRILNTYLLTLVNVYVPSTCLLSKHDLVISNEVDLHYLNIIYNNYIKSDLSNIVHTLYYILQKHSAACLNMLIFEFFSCIFFYVTFLLIRQRQEGVGISILTDFQASQINYRNDKICSLDKFSAFQI